MNTDRLAQTFTTLCEISSPSRKEAKISAHLKELFRSLGADSIYEDNSGAATGSEVGNLIIRFEGNREGADAFFLACHMDTVGPCDDVRVVREGDIFRSAGDTILGGDDKSGIAAIIEMIQTLKEDELSYPTIEIIITTCEEIGLLGAKHLEYDKIESTYGYALDSSGIGHVVIGAPAANRITLEINGRAAHAGLCPEVGINSLTVAVNALKHLRLGRLDSQSTCNIGVIRGGVATNIVPARMVLTGEVRSHDPEKLVSHTEHIISTFKETAAAFREKLGAELPTVSVHVHDDYPVLRLDEDSPVVNRIRKAGTSAGQDLGFIEAGGGSDANIYFGHGLQTAIIATGMDKVHTVQEQLAMCDLIQLTELLLHLCQTDQ